jgi:DNA-binding response OmpR family regulator
VVTAADGPHAPILAQTGTFDVIVLDVILPGLSGFQVLRQPRAERVTTPVLLIVAKDSDRIVLIFVTFPSTAPLLQGSVSPARTAS